jgi:Ca2+-binding RTX toxin-like protein
MNADSIFKTVVAISKAVWTAQGLTDFGSDNSSVWSRLTAFFTPDSQIQDELQTTTGLEVWLVDQTSGSGNFNAGYVKDVFFVAPENTSVAVTFDTANISSWQGIKALALVGSSQADTLNLDVLPFGEVALSTLGGADTIKVGVGTNIVAANVTIDSGADGDTIEIRAGNAEIKTGAGEDTISLISGGTFEVDAGADKDTIRIGDIGNSTINGGGGEDTVDYSGRNIQGINPVTSGVKFDLSQQGPGLIVSQGSYTHTLVSVEKIILSQFVDEVVGDSQVNKFEGLGGNDILTGGGGADTLDGGADDDTADYSKESGGGIKITLGGGNTISVVDGSGSTDTLISIEKVIGTSKEDKLTLNTLQTDIELDLGEGDDTIDLTNAGSGVTVDLYSDKVGSLEILNAEHIIGTSGADDITGNDENNRIVGGGGVDEIDGGGGDDIIYNGDDKGSDDGAKEALYGGDGFDTYYIGVGDTINDSDGIGSVYSGGKMFSGGIHPYWDYDSSARNIDIHHCSN